MLKWFFYDDDTDHCLLILWACNKGEYAVAYEKSVSMFTQIFCDGIHKARENPCPQLYTTDMPVDEEIIIKNDSFTAYHANVYICIFIFIILY